MPQAQADCAIHQILVSRLIRLNPLQLSRRTVRHACTLPRAGLENFRSRNYQFNILTGPTTPWKMGGQNLLYKGAQRDWEAHNQ